MTDEEKTDFERFVLELLAKPIDPGEPTAWTCGYRPTLGDHD
jgi:hypothetical protein